MTVPEFVYSVLLRPRPLRFAASTVLRAIVPEKVVRHGATIVLNPDDPVISGALTLGVYENAETSFFLSACQPGMTFLDIGANCGYYTALFLSRSGPESRVIALEPDPQCFAFLERTVAANQGRNVTCLRMAASDGCGTARLYRNLDNRGDNRLYANDLATSFCKVETDTVDSMLERLGVRSLNLVKLDVQGFEGKVLRGMRKTLAEAPRLILMSEFWPHGLAQGGTDPSWVVEFLDGMGFHLFLLGGRGKLREMEHPGRVIRSYRGRRYTNIVATKGVDFRRWLDNHA